MHSIFDSLNNFFCLILLNRKTKMRSKIQKFIISLTIFIFFMTIVEYLLKFGFKEFNYQKVLIILPGMVLDFGVIASIFIIYYLIKYKIKK